MTTLALLFILASIGISQTLYLIRKRKAQEVPVCVVGSSCHEVLQSKYSKLFLFHNDIWGLLFYTTTAISTALLALNILPVYGSLFVKLSVGFGGLFSIFLTYLQWKVVRAWCFWCLMSAFIVWAMGIIILTSPAA